jgi:hypothetical protein
MALLGFGLGLSSLVKNQIQSLNHRNLTEREGSVQFTFLYSNLYGLAALILKYYLLFYKTSYIYEEVNCTGPSTSVCVPCLNSSARVRSYYSNLEC